MLRTWARWLLAIVAVFGTGSAEAARVAVRNYTPAQGLPQHQVLTLDQDARGFLWVGTLTGGLGRYDGKRWEIFDASSGLAGSGVYDVAEDSDGTLLAATTGGLARFTSTGWTVLEPTRTKVTVLLPGPGGVLLLGTSTGLLRRAGGTSAAAPVEAAKPLLGGATTTLVRALDGGAWVGTTQGLGRLGPDGRRVDLVAGLPAARVLAVLERPARPLLVSLDGIGLFEGAAGAFRRLGDDQVPGRRVSAVHAVRHDPDDLWIGTSDRGAYRFKGGVFIPFGTTQGLVDVHVNAILEDREGVLWFGTDSGLTKRGPSAFVTMDDSDGFPAGASIFGMDESRDGSIWFTAWDEGIVRLDSRGVVRRFTADHGLPHEEVMDVSAHPGGGVVVATRHQLLRIEGDRITRIPKPSGFPASVTGLHILPDGRLVVESKEGVFVGEIGGKFAPVPESVGMDVHGLSPLPDGTMWFGGDGGAYGFRPGTPGVTHLSREQGLPSNHVTEVFQDSQGRLWVGTDAGVFRRDPNGHVSTLDRRDGLPDPYVYFIGEDPERGVWFGTNRGAARLDATGRLRTFTTRDGLGSDECNEDGFFVDSHGRVWIGSAGVSQFLALPRLPRAASPPVWIERVFFNGRSLPLSESPRLPNQPRAVTFRFVSPSFTDENAIRFSYRLGGLSEDWTDGGPGQDEVTYARLGAGHYVFEVVARTSDGRVSGTPASFAFEVRPLWWRTLPAAAAALTLLVGGTVLLIRLRERQLVSARRQLEYEVEARTDDLRLANERLAALAVTDDLTGVANRRRLIERLEEAMAFARRRGTPLSVVLADLDYFKLVNDRLGHTSGDAVLQKVAQAMAGVLRTEDLLGRYGGDEFMAVFPGTDAAGAQDAAERLRQAVADVDFGEEVASLLAQGLTISVGVAAFDPAVRDAAELVRRADNALYRSKEGGRNRVSEDRTQAPPASDG